MSGVLVAPSILSADFANLERDIQKISTADLVHVDVMDGVFVPNITIGAPVVAAIRKTTKLPLDVHLMIVNPEKHIEAFAKAGADYLTVHYEAVKDNVCAVLEQIKSYGIKAGLSIKPKTKPEEIAQYTDLADLILVMTVEPGFGGQAFMPDCAEKIKYFAEKCKPGTIIEVDGGINEATGRLCVEYGANALVAGSYVYKNRDIEAAINSLRQGR